VLDRGNSSPRASTRRRLIGAASPEDRYERAGDSDCGDPITQRCAATPGRLGRLWLPRHRRTRAPGGPRAAARAMNPSSAPRARPTGLCHRAPGELPGARIATRVAGARVATCAANSCGGSGRRWAWRRPRPSGRNVPQRRRRALSVVDGRHGPHGDTADPDLLSGRQLDHGPAEVPQPARAARGHDDGRAGASRRSEGSSRWSRCACEISTASSAPGRRLLAPAADARLASATGVREQADPESTSSTVEWPSQVSRSAATSAG
jgi:hypothetical protein